MPSRFDNVSEMFINFSQHQKMPGFVEIVLKFADDDEEHPADTHIGKNRRIAHFAGCFFVLGVQ